MGAVTLRAADRERLQRAALANTPPCSPPVPDRGFAGARGSSPVVSYPSSSSIGPIHPIARSSGPSHPSASSTGPGPVAVAQVASCQRWVAELRGSLATLAERCASLEELHGGVLATLGIGPTASAAVPPATQKMQDLGAQHAELMLNVRQLMADVGREANACLDDRGGEAAATRVLPLSGAVPRPDWRMRFHDVNTDRPPPPQGAAPSPGVAAIEPLAERIGQLNSATIPPGAGRVPDIHASIFATAEEPVDRVELVRRRAAELNGACNAVALGVEASAELPPAAHNASAAISDVWARYHPSRCGGAPPTWFGNNDAALSQNAQAAGTPQAATILDPAVAPLQNFPPPSLSLPTLAEPTSAHTGLSAPSGWTGPALPEPSAMGGIASSLSAPPPQAPIHRLPTPTDAWWQPQAPWQLPPGTVGTPQASPLSGEFQMLQPLPNLPAPGSSWFGSEQLTPPSMPVQFTNLPVRH